MKVNNNTEQTSYMLKNNQEMWKVCIFKQILQNYKHILNLTGIQAAHFKYKIKLTIHWITVLTSRLNFTLVCTEFVKIQFGSDLGFVFKTKVINFKYKHKFLLKATYLLC